MPIQRTDALEAMASVNGGTGAAVVARGCVTARTGVGVYTVTLDRDCDAADCVIQATLRGGAINGGILVTHTSDTVKTVNTSTAAAAADRDFDISVFRIAAGNF